MPKHRLCKSMPLHLVIAADASISPEVNPINDQIWELNLPDGWQEEICLQTTYGLRARWMRIIPRFFRMASEGDQKPGQKPELIDFLPNYLAVQYEPLFQLNVILEYWIVNSFSIAGRIRLHNKNDHSLALRMELAGILNPGLQGNPMSATQVGINHILQGQVKDLWLVCCMSGGPQSHNNPDPALLHDFELLPGNQRQFSWALASANDMQSSHELARSLVNRSWDAEIARLELNSISRQTEILTGNPDWDAALAFSQKAAYQMLVPSVKGLPGLTLVQSRIPDHGFSPRGDGSDLSSAWIGASPLDVYALIQNLLPGNPQVCKGFVDNFLFLQEDDGWIDCRAGIAGQSSGFLAQPLLATVSWKIFQVDQDTAWLKSIYPFLIRFAQRWFQKDVDVDQDGFPEWKHPIQTGIPSLWNLDPGKFPPELVENPALGAWLYKELASLEKISKALNFLEDLPWIDQRKTILKHEIDTCWDPKVSCYRYRDFHSHECPGNQKIAKILENGIKKCRKTFSVPRRVDILVKMGSMGTRNLELVIRGEANRKILEERITTRKFSWTSTTAHYTSINLFDSTIEIEVTGLHHDDEVDVRTMDCQSIDISNLLPLWAGIPDQKQAKLMIEKWGATGMGSYGLTTDLLPLDGCSDTSCSVVWNAFLIEGMIEYGYHEIAAKLMSLLLNQISHTLVVSNTFRESFDGSLGVPTGEQNHLHGFAPTCLFLSTLGVQLGTGKSVLLQGINPYPFPVTVKYQGMSITRHIDDTMVIFASGQSCRLSGAGPYVVSIDPSNQEVGQE